jgi:hypothetical protein
MACVDPRRPAMPQLDRCDLPVLFPSCFLARPSGARARALPLFRPRPHAPAAPQPDRRAPRRSEAAAAARRTAAGEIVIAAAGRGRLLSPRAGPLRTARRGSPSPAGARRRAPDCEGTGTKEAPRRRRRFAALTQCCFAASARGLTRFAAKGSLLGNRTPKICCDVEQFWR